MQVIYNNEYYEFKIDKDVNTNDYGYVTFNVYVRDHYFQGMHSFCLSKKELKCILTQLQEVNQSLSGNFKITDCESESYITFSVDKAKVYVKGQLGSQYEDNMLIFEQNLDQTVLELLYTELKKYYVNIL